MKSLKIEINDENESIEFAKKVGALLSPGDVVGLKGDLGAGKTFICREISKALGVPDSQQVHSPTFNIINEYAGGRLPVYHMDFYRLGDVDELYELGIWEYYEGSGVTLVEWFDKFDDLWPEEALIISIELKDNSMRTITLEGRGRAEELILKLAD
ncbi:MAG: tRNA (adenosine(37)-N6)-threonylcarbamoyltransferase complex ATPase subunit type 1 TsaE [Deltaproteobacteria bacterium]|nr:tRNA (adenosine(37)-N6)-threonylcarbamoyltransferase complex ATPase subunit type 1 TsaE [Deltaproteobacteria bacterium]